MEELSLEEEKRIIERVCSDLSKWDGKRREPTPELQLMYNDAIRIVLSNPIVLTKLGAPISHSLTDICMQLEKGEPVSQDRKRSLTQDKIDYARKIFEAYERDYDAKLCTNSPQDIP